MSSAYRSARRSCARDTAFTSGSSSQRHRTARQNEDRHPGNVGLTGDSRSGRPTHPARDRSRTGRASAAPLRARCPSRCRDERDARARAPGSPRFRRPNVLPAACPTAESAASGRCPVSAALAFRVRSLSCHSNTPSTVRRRAAPARPADRQARDAASGLTV